MKKISREEAARLGLKRYFTGTPCIHGHLCERYVSAKSRLGCVECQRLTSQKYKERNLERFLQCNRLAQQKRRERDPSRVRQLRLEWIARQKAKKVQENSHSR